MPDQQSAWLQLNPKQKIQDELAKCRHKKSCDLICSNHENSSKLTKNENRFEIQQLYSLNNQHRHKSLATSLIKPADKRH